VSGKPDQASIVDILSAPIMRTAIRNVLGGKPIYVAERPGAYVLSIENEPSDHCKRIIILKPRGFTSNSPSELSSHPEASEATIEIKGAVRPGNKGYFPIKNCIEFVHRYKDGAEIERDYPYASASGAFREIKTSRTRFKAVKRNYYGFYHNLINLTDEWLILFLNKKLNLTKQVDYSLIERVGKEQRDALYNFARWVKDRGDEVFVSRPDVVKHVCSMDPRVSIPALITLLNIEEKGRHEQCTVFATILKVAKKHPALAYRLLKKAKEEEAAQPYYLHELIKKVKGYSK
jgi:hypothetical protein